MIPLFLFNHKSSYRMENKRAEKPKYLIASTNLNEQETYVFECIDYRISSFDDYGGLAKRWGDENWDDPEAAVHACFPKDAYIIISSTPGVYGPMYIFGLEEPNELTHWDGDESDRIVY
jgi:hypothetical protein